MEINNLLKYKNYLEISGDELDLKNEDSKNKSKIL